VWLFSGAELCYGTSSKTWIGERKVKMFASKNQSSRISKYLFTFYHYWLFPMAMKASPRIAFGSPDNVIPFPSYREVNL
jgi:hypothetical protein